MSEHQWEKSLVMKGVILSEDPKWKFKKKDAGLADPSEYIGGSLLRVPPDPPGLKIEAVHYFEPRDEFQTFRKLLKSKLKYRTD